MRLNLGSKGYRIEGYINVDINPDCKPDVVADVRDLPYEEGSIDSLYGGHLLEHFDCIETPWLLREWYRVLKRGGELILSFPDFRKVFEKYLKLELDEEQMNSIIFANARREGQTHHQLLDYGIVRGQFEEAGFTCVTQLESYPHTVISNDCGWQTIVRCVK